MSDNKVKTTPEFNRLYKMLNNEQREAVDTVEGSVMVVAGPGTGKTQILTLRIANILKETDATPDSILALTFTEAGVSAMRKRLVSIIGQEGYKVPIYTYHGFCNEVIKRYPDEFPRIIGSESITDIEQVSILRDVLDAEQWQHLRPFGNNYYFLIDIRTQISELKREAVTPEELRGRLAAARAEVESADDLYHEKGRYKGQMKGVYREELKRIERGEELANIYERYEGLLRERRLYDYEDMILEVKSVLEEDNAMLLKLQEKYQYILADEHQDANGAQNRILELLSNFHEDPNLFIVGDEKQAIYRFQGASLENFNYFKELYPKARLINLANNYRSGQAILDGAHSLMEGKTIYNAPLSAQGVHKDTKTSITLRTFSHQESELLWVARDIKRKIEEGVEPTEIAVLYRNNADAHEMSLALQAEGIMHRIESSQNALEDPEMLKLLVVLYAVAEFGSSSRLVPTMHLPFLGLSPTSVYRILRFARRNRVAVFDIFQDKTLLAKTGADTKEALRFIQTLERLAQDAREESVPEFFNTLVRESGFLAHALNSRRAGELVEKLQALSAAITELARKDKNYALTDLVEHLNMLEEYNIPIKASARSVSKSAVRLMTAHKSKGLEFDFVYIIGLYDKHWGNKHARNMFKLPGLGQNKESDDDERRLFYVALTRARVGVSLSYAEVGQEEREQQPSMFIEEIKPEFLERVDTAEFEESLTPEDSFRPRVLPTSFVQDKDYLNELFSEFGLSVTALNNYLSCPWQYFYRNLVRIPEPPSKHLALGNAVHAALQAYHEKKPKKIETANKLLQAEFIRALERQPLSQPEFEEVSARGSEALSAWLSEYHGKLNMHTVNELELSVLLPLESRNMPNILLRGKLDKIELGETEGASVRVVDYKTGKPKSRNEILGETKTSNGDYHRQLVFYKLLLDLHNKSVRETGKGRIYDMRAGVIDFIQPDAKSGKLRKEEFVIDNDEVEKLRVEINRVAKEIYNLDFWNTRCDNHAKGNCKYCELRDLMR